MLLGPGGRRVGSGGGPGAVRTHGWCAPCAAGRRSWAFLQDGGAESRCPARPGAGSGWEESPGDPRSGPPADLGQRTEPRGCTRGHLALQQPHCPVRPGNKLGSGSEAPWHHGLGKQGTARLPVPGSSWERVSRPSVCPRASDTQLTPGAPHPPRPRGSLCCHSRLRAASPDTALQSRTCSSGAVCGLGGAGAQRCK